jgi:Uma2 family endonuclease
MIFARGIGDKAVVSIQNEFAIDRYNQPQPDVVLIRPREGFYGTKHPQPNEVALVIEVSETSIYHDRKVKLPIYARSGVPEVWIIDLNNDVIEICRQPKDRTFSSIQRHHRGEFISPEAFPDFLIKVDDLLG